MATQSDELKWKLAGIRDEIKQTDLRRAYLIEQEQALINAGLTGTNGKAKSTPKVAGKRKRQIDPETRRKMSEGAKKRWAEKKSAQPQQAAETAEASAPPAPVV